MPLKGEIMNGAQIDRPKVLIIDDNPSIVDVIRHALRRHGQYETIVAYDGVEGLERYYSESPICVVVDAKMPRMDGFQFLRCLRGDLESANTALVMLTALVRDEDQITGLLSGADEYLTKPFKPSALIAAIERAIHMTPEARMERIEALWQRLQSQP
jgi:two-component system OmpR family response regulator